MEWISVKDRFPEIEQYVLVYQKGGVFGGQQIDIAYRTHEFYPEEKEDNNKIAWHGQGICNNIHFWMPLPNPPKNKEKPVLDK